ncbi:MAG: Gfo/Idh/MocA family oxidoreductase [Thermoguttaceae bacterium]
MQRIDPKPWSRRQFLKNAMALSGSLATPVLIQSSALGKDGTVAPSNRIALGFIGIGMMGQGHLRGCLQYPEVQVVAVCDVDRWRRENAKTATELAYAAKQVDGTYRGCQAYNDLRELIDRPDVDATVIATGDRWHATAAILAAKAGKDIYCEKPMSLTLGEGRAMVDAVRRYGRVFQTGLQQRSGPEFRKACRLVLGGRIGKVKFVYVNFPGTVGNVNLPVEPVPEGLDWDLWLGPAPWRPFNRRFHPYGRPPHVVPWHFCRDFGGGNLTSNAVHAFDVVQWGLGMDQSGPVEIIPPETGRYPVLTYKYADDVLVQVDWKLDEQKNFVPKGWDVNTPIQSFGALFVGEGGWIHVGRQGFLEGYPDGILEDDSVASRPANNHHQDWLHCIKTREMPVCDVAIGCRSTTVSQLGCIAHWTGRSLKWDPLEEKFTGDEEANRLRSRAMRAPWRV